MLFVLNENPIVWAMALSKVEFTGGRYVKVGDRCDDAYDLLLEIVRNGHQIALSCELWDNYANWRSRLQTSGIASSPHPLDMISGLWRQRPDRVVFDPVPPVVPLPTNFPDDDRYLAYLAIATTAIIVTEDEGVLAAAAGGALGFDAVSIADALRRARAPE